jgi:hypothetical protein
MPEFTAIPYCGSPKTYIGEVVKFHPSELSTVQATPTTCSSGQPHCQTFSQGWAVITESLNILDIQDPIPSSVFFDGNLRMGTERAYLLNNFGATAILGEHYYPWLYVPPAAISKLDPEFFSSCHVRMEKKLASGVPVNPGVWDPPIPIPQVASLTSLPEPTLHQTAQARPPIPSASPGSAITSSPFPIESNAVKSSPKPQDMNPKHPAKTSSAPQPNISNGVQGSAPGFVIPWIFGQLLGQTSSGPQSNNANGVQGVVPDSAIPWIFGQLLGQTPSGPQSNNANGVRGSAPDSSIPWIFSQLLGQTPSGPQPNNANGVQGVAPGSAISWIFSQLLGQTLRQTENSDSLVPGESPETGSKINGKYDGQGLSWMISQLLELMPSNLLPGLRPRPSLGVALDNDPQHQGIGVLSDTEGTDLDNLGNPKPHPTATFNQVSGTESPEQSSQTTGLLSGDNGGNTHSTDGRTLKPLESGKRLKNESKVTSDMPWRLLLFTYGLIFFFST